MQECINPMPEKDMDLFVIKLLACSLAAALIMVKLTYKNSFLICLTALLAICLIQSILDYILKGKRNNR